MPAKKINESQNHQGQARIEHLPAPVAADEPARFGELTALFAFIDAPARAVETANVATASPGAVHDGVTLAANDRLLLIGQTENHQNGLYVFKGATEPLERTTDIYKAGTAIVTGPDGTTYGNSLWLQTTDNPVVGTTALTFINFGQILTAGTGLTRTGNVMAITSPVAVALGGTGATTAANARKELNTPGVYKAEFGDAVHSSFEISHNLKNQYPGTVKVINKSTGEEEDCSVKYVNENMLELSSAAWEASPPVSKAYVVVVHG